MPTLTQLAEVWRKERAMSDLIKREDAIEAECSSCAWRDQCEEDSGYWCESGGLVRRDIPSVETKQVKYFDEDEKVWKVGEVIVADRKTEPIVYKMREPTEEEKQAIMDYIEDELQTEMPEYAEWKDPFEKMMEGV